MGNALKRDQREVQESDGSTLFSILTPTLTLAGSKDGLMRVSRIAESYWHQVTNINSSQATLFPVEVLSGVAHYQFADASPPKDVAENDLKGDVTVDEAHSLIGSTMASFIGDVLKSGGATSSKATGEYLAPLLEGMRQEGSQVMKEPCN